MARPKGDASVNAARKRDILARCFYAQGFLREFGTHDLRDALAAFERHYLAGDTRLAEQEFARAKAEIARTGRGA